MPFDVGDGGGGAASVSSAELSTIFSWVAKVPAREAESLAMKYFSLEQLKRAANFVKPYAECTIPQGDQPEKLCKNLVKAVAEIANEEEPKVQFFVAATDLMKVPGVEGTIMPLDTASVGARLLNMESSVDKLSASLHQVQGLGPCVENLAKVVTNLQEQTRKLQQDAPGIEETVHEQQIGRQYADVVAGNGKRKRGPEGPNSPQQSTPSRPLASTPPSAVFRTALEQNGRAVPGLSQMLRVQRQQVEEAHFEMAGSRKQRRRQHKMVQGASEVQAGGGLPAPFSVFIRNTDPSYTEGDVKKYLLECAGAMPEEEKLGKELEIVQVNHIPLSRRDGAPLRSKCWKVTVAAEFKDHMLKGTAYPSGWSARQWYPGRQTNSGQSVEAGADPRGFNASKWSGPPGLYGRQAVEVPCAPSHGGAHPASAQAQSWHASGTESLAPVAGNPVEPQVPRPHTSKESQAQTGSSTPATGSSMVVA